MRPLLLALLALSLLTAGPVDRVARHLAGVEVALRWQTPATLTPAQRLRREAALDHLAAYRRRGVFPHRHPPPNEPSAPEGRARPAAVAGAYVERLGETPVFRDAHGVWCAVGQLLVDSGHLALARWIAATQNLAYVDEIAAPELAEWAQEHGLALAELAAIQPSYEPRPTPMPRWAAPVVAAEAGALAATVVNLRADRLGEPARGPALMGVGLGALSAAGGMRMMWEAKYGGLSDWDAVCSLCDTGYSVQTRYNLFGMGALGTTIGFSSALVGASNYLEWRQREPETEEPALHLALGPGAVVLAGSW